MAIKDILKVSRKTFFDPVTWIDFNSLKILNKTLFTQLADLFRTPKPVIIETFEQAVQRFDLQEEDLKTIEKEYRSYAFFFLIFGLGIIGFALYLLIHHGSIHGSMVGVAVAALCVAQAVRYDFWAFQIKKRQLGCTLKDWKRDWLGD